MDKKVQASYDILKPVVQEVLIVGPGCGQSMLLYIRFSLKTDCSRAYSQILVIAKTESNNFFIVH